MSKYENKFAKLQKKAAEFNFRNQLKVVKKKEFTLEEEDKEVRIPFITLPTMLRLRNSLSFTIYIPRILSNIVNSAIYLGVQ